MESSKKEVLSFDNWWKKHNCVKETLRCEDARYVYESRQADIDDLQRRIDDACMWCEKGCILKAMAILKGE